MCEWLPVIERALQARGWSARHASMEAVDNANLISNMRRGKVPSVDRFRALCEVLGLEFYVGPPRAGRLLEEERLGVAVELAERALAAMCASVGATPTRRAWSSRSTSCSETVVRRRTPRGCASSSTRSGVRAQAKVRRRTMPHTKAFNHAWYRGGLRCSASVVPVFRRHVGDIRAHPEHRQVDGWRENCVHIQYAHATSPPRPSAQLPQLPADGTPCRDRDVPVARWRAANRCMAGLHRTRRSTPAASGGVTQGRRWIRKGAEQLHDAIISAITAAMPGMHYDEALGRRHHAGRGGTVEDNCPCASAAEHE